MKLAWLFVLASCAGASKSQPTTTTSASSTTSSDAATPLPATTVTPVPPVATQYSCFSYTSGATKRYGCARSSDCDDYLEQARAVGGLRDLTACTAVPTVACFHTKTDDSDICQPTMELCASERATMKSADSDCVTR